MRHRRKHTPAELSSVSGGPLATGVAPTTFSIPHSVNNEIITTHTEIPSASDDDSPALVINDEAHKSSNDRVVLASWNQKKLVSYFDFYDFFLCYECSTC